MSSLLDRLKAGLTLIAGWLLAGAVALLWFLSRRKSVVLKPPHVEPKKVPDDIDDVESELRKRGLLK